MADQREHQQTVQRVKVGTIGLVIVVLLIGLASAVMRTATREAPIATAGAPKTDVVANMIVANGQQEAAEPLAELGVAPMTDNGQAVARVTR